MSGNYDFLQEKETSLTFQQIVECLKKEIEPISERFTKNYILGNKKEEKFEK